MKAPDGYITTKEYAQRYGLKTDTVGRLCHAAVLESRRYGGLLIVKSDQELVIEQKPLIEGGFRNKYTVRRAMA